MCSVCTYRSRIERLGILSMVMFLLGCIMCSGLQASKITLKSGSVSMTLNSETGRIEQMAIGGKSCLQSRSVSVSGFSIWDHAQKDGWKPLACRVRQNGRNTVFEWNGDGLVFTASMTAVKNGWEVKGNVTRSSVERFLSIRFGLPIDVTGWIFWKDLIRRQPMETTRDYTITSPNKLGAGYIDYIPMTSISCDRGAIGFAVWMDEQWFHHTAYRADSGLYNFVQDFALIDGQRKYEKSAPFHFYIFTPSGPWGLRSVTSAYFDIFPQWRGEKADHKGPAHQAGGWIAWGDIAIHSSPLSDFGLLYHEGPDKNGYTTCDNMGYYGLPYIEPSMYQQYHGDLNRVPTYDEAYSRMKANAEATVDQVQHPAADAREWIHGMSSSLLKSAICDPDGRPIEPACGNWPWIGGTNYGAQFPLNLDPDIPGGVGQYRLDECRKMIANPSSDGIYLDSYCAHFQVVDYSRTNVQASRIPPTFNADLKPCVTVWSALSSWVEDLIKMLPENKRCVLPNMFAIAGPTSWQCMDILGKEWWYDPTGGLMAKLRQLGYHKVLTQLPAYTEQDYKFLKQLLVFDVVPGGYGGGPTEPPEKSRASYGKLMPVFRILHNLMWQPVTMASSDLTGVIVERYGMAPGPVVFVVSNTGDAGIANVDIDRSVIPGGYSAWCYDPLKDNPLSWRWKSGKLKVSVALDRDQTAVFVVGSQNAQKKFKQMWTQDRLNDVRLCFKEYKLRKKSSHPLESHFRKLHDSSDMRSLASAVKPDGPITSRIRELLLEAADSCAASANPVALKPVKIASIQQKTVQNSTLPFAEEFDSPINPDKWEVEKSAGRLDVENGQAVFELKDAVSVTMKTKDAFDFRTAPIVLEAKFQTNKISDEKWYVGTFISLNGDGDYLLVRIDDGNQIRLENSETAATDWTSPVFDYKPIDPKTAHDLKFYVDSIRYRLELDGKLVSEGIHGAIMTKGTASLTMSSGHQGHGDTWNIDYIRIRRVKNGEWKK